MLELFYQIWYYNKKEWLLMKPEDVNRLNKRNNTIEKVYKFCPKCNEIKLVSCYVSKCPVCKTQFENCKQPTQSNVPRCPTCGSTKIKRISALNRAAHGYAFGLFSKTARSQFCCQNCNYKW